MIKRALKKIIKKFGYNIKKENNSESTGFELFSYQNKDGSFDYEKYKKTQIEGNKLKINSIWVLEENIAFLSQFLKKSVPNMEFGICHGTRRGKEQEWFRKHLSIEVIGTEISDTAENFPHTIQWDFHETKDEWINNVDFIYSNSFDHSYDPKKCLDSWTNCLKPNGICIIEHTSVDEFVTELDPFAAKLSVMPFLVLTWANGKYFVADILTAPVSKEAAKYTKFLIIKKSE